MKLLIGTKNRGKFIELSEVLAIDGLELIQPDAVGIDVDPEETGDTFEANALQKARYYFERSNLPTVADDSGIIVEALVNELGIHTRRWGAGADASDDEWVAYFLDRMKHEQNKRAHFVCVLAFIDKTGKEHTFEGRCDGVITDELEADYLTGLPISACFRPDGYNCVFSALKLEQKNSTSHRGRAAHMLRTFLENQ